MDKKSIEKQIKELQEKLNTTEEENKGGEKKMEYDPYAEFNASPSMDTWNMIKEKAEKQGRAALFMYTTLRDGIPRISLDKNAQLSDSYLEKGIELKEAVCHNFKAQKLLIDISKTTEKAKDEEDKKVLSMMKKDVDMKMSEVDKLLTFSEDDNMAKVDATFLRGIFCSRKNDYAKSEEYMFTAAGDGHTKAGLNAAVMVLTRVQKDVNKLREALHKLL